MEIVQLIKQSQANALRVVNTELINLYWNIGAYIKPRLTEANWGENAIDDLAHFIQKNHPELKGFSRSALYRMVQFYDIYAGHEFVAPVELQIQNNKKQSDTIVAPLARQFESKDIRNTILAQLSWTNHLIIFSRCKTPEEREFYIQMSIRERYSKRELDRQISSGLFERIMLGKTNSGNLSKSIKDDLGKAFKDSYIFEFLDLSEPHNERDLQKNLVRKMKDFILELGKDFLHMGEQYRLQVGMSDFYIDLLFYHRGLQCMVAFELKADKFKPEHLGQLNFYLEALDRDVKRPNENPSIGILLCKDRDHEVVEYAMSRSLSSTMVAEYKTQLPDKKLLQRKLHELLGNSGHTADPGL